MPRRIRAVRVMVFFMLGEVVMLVGSGVFCNCWLCGVVAVRKVGYLNL